jgi:hypothetical protein
MLFPLDPAAARDYIGARFSLGSATLVARMVDRQRGNQQQSGNHARAKNRYQRYQGRIRAVHRCVLAEI